MLEMIKRAEQSSLQIALMLKEKQEQYPELKTLTDKEIGAMAKDLYLKTLKRASEIKL